MVNKLVDIYWYHEGNHLLHPDTTKIATLAQSNKQTHKKPYARSHHINHQCITERSRAPTFLSGCLRICTAMVFRHVYVVAISQSEMGELFDTSLKRRVRLWPSKNV